jgi:hypothetical protein
MASFLYEVAGKERTSVRDESEQRNDAVDGQM